MQQYLDLLRKIKDEGEYKAPAREGMPGTYSLFGYQFRHNLQEGFPALTTKKLYWKGVVAELCWFLRGDTNIKFLLDNDCNIWNEDAMTFYLKQIGKDSNGEYHIKPMTFDMFVERVKDDRYYEKSRLESRSYKLGDCGKQYGSLWRKWENCEGEPVDQILNLVQSLQNNPESRRHIITAWNPATLDEMALPACHSFVQFNTRKLSFSERWAYVTDQGMADSMSNGAGCTFETYNIPKYKLDCKFTMRSVDTVLGLPFNIASYALLTHIIAKVCNMEVGDLIADLGDTHIYNNHLDAVNEQLTRTPTKLPTLQMPDITMESTNNLFNLNIEDFKLIDYSSQSAIKAKLSTGLR